MESSRIFVRGLPPTFKENEFKKHFGQKLDVTDAKLFPQRRIGYVGYKTYEDAVEAVKYFNKSFIRMSKIGVEIARPIQDAKPAKSASAPTAQKTAAPEDERNNPLKRKRGSQGREEEDPKLKEFLQAMKPASKTKVWQNEDGEAVVDAVEAQSKLGTEQTAASDSEYEEVPKKQKWVKESGTEEDAAAQDQTVEAGGDHPSAPMIVDGEASENMEDEATIPAQAPDANAVASDADWLRSRTSRLLGLLDEEEEATGTGRTADDEESDHEETKVPAKRREVIQEEQPVETNETDPIVGEEASPPEDANDEATEAVRTSMRLFLRNLAYSVTEEDIESEFAPFGGLTEVQLPVDTKTGARKGFAHIQFDNSESAEQAFNIKDGTVFQGRLLHVLPGKAKPESKLDDFALSKLPLKKQQQIKRKREASSATFNWNALYMNADAVISSVADRLGLAKSEVLDPTSSDAAVRQAHAETHIIQETKAYFGKNGVDLDSFKTSQRGDTAILVKNIPYDVSADELKRLFEEHGKVVKFLLPPSGVIAIIEFAQAPQAKAAFASLAYRKMKSSVLFLEKAPKDLFKNHWETSESKDVTSNGVSKVSTSDLLQEEAPADSGGSATLYVRNLNFTTTNDRLTELFKPLEGFLSARVKTKTDPKKPGQVLSMGFGFVEFVSKQQAQAALSVMDGYSLEGHKLQIRISHKGLDAAEERRRDDKAKKAVGRKTKIIIKNLPFEASKKDVRALFSAYGQLRSVRVPKKMDRAARGFAFADFTTPKEAESAMDALRDTHLLGRRLVLDFAAEDPEDAEAEIEKMQQKVGSQVNKVALQKLTSGGRKKFTTGNEEDA